MSTHKSIHGIAQLNDRQQQELINFLQPFKAELHTDPSSYTKGRLIAWLGAEWSFKERRFEAPDLHSDALWRLCQKIYPGCHLAPLTYSGEAGKGIKLYRDDIPCQGIVFTSRKD
jgi:hypothetical protein